MQTLATTWEVSLNTKPGLNLFDFVLKGSLSEDFSVLVFPAGGAKPQWWPSDNENHCSSVQISVKLTNKLSLRFIYFKTCLLFFLYFFE